MGREWTRIELNEPFDLSKRKAWFMDGVHTMPRWPSLPLDHVWPMAERGLTWACQRISQPHCKGWMWRTREGSAFLSPIMVTDPEERKQREVKFKENLKPFIENFHGLWDKYKKKWEDIWSKANAFNLEKASDIELEDFYRDLVRYEEEVWKDHFYIMEGVGSLTLLFEDLARDIAGINSGMPIWSKLSHGFPSKAFESDDKMHELAQKAIQLGLKDLFAKYDGQELYDKIKAHPKGQEYVKELTAFLSKDYGDRLMQLLNYATPTWREKPELITDRVKLYVMSSGEYRHAARMAQAVKDREAAEKEIMAKVPADQRGWFTALMKSAQNWGWWSEEHEFWLNEAVYSLMRRVMLEYGKRFVKYGTFDKVDDIFHIREKDFERVIHAPWDFNLRPEVAKNRAELEQFQKIQSQPIVCYDTIPGAVGWLMPMREFHVALSLGYMPEPKAGVNASLWGTCGSPGTVEGIAKVIFSEDQFGEINPGDILVSPTTYVTWTPIFSKIGGLVVDRGGSLSHSAICAREYGIPCILNTFTGTQTIKSGQKIKLQADIGAVFVL
jgi:pyruvate,water dikinase